MWIAVWQNADYIVEGEYTTGAQEQLYIETNGMIAEFDADQRRHSVGFAAVSLLRPQGADGGFRSAGRPKFAWCKRKREARSAARKNTPR